MDPGRQEEGLASHNFGALLLPLYRFHTDLLFILELTSANGASHSPIYSTFEFVRSAEWFSDWGKHHAPVDVARDSKLK